MDSNWVHGLTGKFHNHRPYSKRVGAKANPFVGRPSTSIPRLQVQRPLGALSHSTIPPLPQLTIRKNLGRKAAVKDETPNFEPESTSTDNFEADDSLSNQLVSFLNPEIEIKSEPNSDVDGDYYPD